MDRGTWAANNASWPANSLHFAIFHNILDELASLIDQGEDVNRLIDGMTPLHVACERWSVSAVRILIDKGAVVDAPGQNGWTPLAVALARVVDRGGEIVEILLKAGADPDYPNNVGDTPRRLAETVDSFCRTNLSRFFAN